MPPDTPTMTPGSTMPAPGMGFGAPGFFGASYAAGGFGAPYGQSVVNQQAGQLQGASLAGMGAAQFVGQTVPGMVGGGLMLGGMLAPLMIAGGGRLTRMAGHAFNFADPFSHAFRMGGWGWTGGRAAAGLMGGGGIASAGAGIAGALMGAAVPLAIGAGAYGAMQYAGSSFMQGSQNYTGAQSFLAAAGGGITGGPLSVGQIQSQAAGLAGDFSQSAHDMRTSPDQIQQIAGMLDSQRYFQSTRSVSEFRAKFKEALNTIKEIAKVTQTSIEEAAQAFGDIRQQGFYSTVDIKGQALRQQGLATATGRTVAEVSQVGAYGAQMARSYGMRGKFGASFLQNVQASVDLGIRNGVIDEEMVEERGGAEAVSARLAQAQMGFLSSARGRVMIANAMGSSGQMDPSRLSRILSGNTSLESLVTGAAGRGIHTLYEAGQPETQQQFMQYAGMAMVSQAVSQQRLLGGSTNEDGILRALRTFGLGRSDARLLLQQTMMQQQMLQQDLNGQSLASQRGQFEDLSRQYSMMGQARRFMYAEIGQPMENFGTRVSARAGRAYSQAAEWWNGYREYSGGDDREYVMGGIRAGYSGFEAMPEDRALGPFAVPSYQQRFRERYSDYLESTSIERPGLSATWLPRSDGYYYKDGGRRFVGVGNGQVAPADVQDRDRIALGARLPELEAAGVASRAWDGTLDRQAYQALFGAEDGRMVGGDLYRRYKTNWELEADPQAAAQQAAWAVAQTLPEGSRGRYEKSLDAFRKESPDVQRAFMAQALSSGAREGDSDMLDAIRKHLGNTDSMSFSSIEGVREQFRAGYEQFFSDLGVAGGGVDVIKDLQVDGAKRSAMADMMQAYAAGDDKAVASAQQRLEGLFADPNVRDQVKDIAAAARNNQDLVRREWGAGGGMLRMTGIRAASEVSTRSRDISAAAYRDMDRAGTLSELGEYQGDFARIATGTLGTYREGWTSLIDKMSRGGVDASEMRALGSIGGGQRGAFALGEVINRARDKDVQGLSGYLAQLGYDDPAGQAKAIAQTKDTDERIAKLITAIKAKSGGALTPDMFSGGVGLSVEGQQGQVWQKQREFVQAVESFMARFQNSGLLRSLLSDEESPAP